MRRSSSLAESLLLLGRAGRAEGRHAGDGEGRRGSRARGPLGFCGVVFLVAPQVVSSHGRAPQYKSPPPQLPPPDRRPHKTPDNAHLPLFIVFL